MTTATRPSPAATAAFMAQAAADPAWFCRTVLGLDLYDKQVEMLESVRDHEQTSVVGGNTLGKDFCTGSALIPWWQSTRYPAKTIIMGPTARQVEQIVWRHTRQSYLNARRPLGGHMMPRNPMWEGDDQHFALGFATDDPQNITGFHSPNLLVIVTEAHAVGDDHITMIKRLTPKRLIFTGNPFSDSGEFYESHHGKGHLYHKIVITAMDSPNVRAGREVIPGLVTQHDIDRFAEDWGEDSPLYRATVLGEFVGSPDGLIPLAWIQAARQREPADTSEPFVAGLDVAGSELGDGDETVLYVRRGPNIIGMHIWNTPEPEGPVLATLRSYGVKWGSINVDAIGLGDGMAKHLRNAGFPVRFVKVGEQANNTERFANKRAEYCWGLRQRFELGFVCGVSDSTTIAQLSALKYKITPKGSIAIESKDEARKRGMKSPDRADALMLAFLTGSQVQNLDVAGSSRWGVGMNSPLDGRPAHEQERSGIDITSGSRWNQ